MMKSKLQSAAGLRTSLSPILLHGVPHKKKFAMKEELYYMITEYIKYIIGILDYNIVLKLCKAQLKT
jgi:hypothetical protein